MDEDERLPSAMQMEARGDRRPLIRSMARGERKALRRPGLR
jgi:hypothetical protein